MHGAPPGLDQPDRPRAVEGQSVKEALQKRFNPVSFMHEFNVDPKARASKFIAEGATVIGGPLNSSAPTRDQTLSGPGVGSGGGSGSGGGIGAGGGGGSAPSPGDTLARQIRAPQTLSGGLGALKTIQGKIQDLLRRREFIFRVDDGASGGAAAKNIEVLQQDTDPADREALATVLSTADGITEVGEQT